MLVFWRLGYECATLAELTRAMGINRPSLYATFGNKEQLFRRALERYASGRRRTSTALSRLPTAREVALELLRGGADRQTQPRKPHGCLAVLVTRTNGGGLVADREDADRGAAGR
jgi:AcrR family transcriptional regulator